MNLLLRASLGALVLATLALQGCGGGGSDSSPSEGSSIQVTPSTWNAVQGMNESRRGQTATLMPNGKVLVVGGLDATGAPMASVEIYDAASNAWTQAAPLPGPRAWHQAISLSSGKVLVFAGVASENPVARLAVESFLYDPSADKWTAVGDLALGRISASAARLANGKVLVVSGDDNVTSTPVANAELFDPASGRWAVVASPHEGRYFATATLLANGKVLLAGGNAHDRVLASAEIYDPRSDSWTQAPQMHAERQEYPATLLPDGRVLVSGGCDSADQPFGASEIYDPAHDSWTVTSSMISARSFPTATLLPNGKVLVAGGFGSVGQLSSSELLDPISGSRSTVSDMTVARGEHSAILLPGAAPRVLVIGGWDDRGQPNASAEMYR